MRIAAGQADRKIRADAIIDTEGQTSGREIKATRIAGAVDIGELAKPCHEDAPAVLRRGLHHRRAALAFWPGRSRKALTEVRHSAVNRKTSRAEPAAPRTNVLHASLQIYTLNICQGNTDIKHRGQLLGRNQFQLGTEFGKWLRVEKLNQPCCARIAHGAIEGFGYCQGVWVAGNLSERTLRAFELDAGGKVNDFGLDE